MLNHLPRHERERVAEPRLGLLQDDANRYIQAAKGPDGRKLFTASSRTNTSADGRDPAQR